VSVSTINKGPKENEPFDTIATINNYTQLFSVQPSSFGDLVLPMGNRVHNLDATCSQSFLPVIMRNEVSRLSFAYENCLDSVFEPQKF